MTTALFEEIALSKLVPSSANVRRTGRELGLEELAASIVAHGLLQNLTVRSALDKEGVATGKFEVVAGGRRLAALKRLAKEKKIGKNTPIPCHVLDHESAQEISLAENSVRETLSPADQFEAWNRLHTEEGLAAVDLAARFGVSETVVRQRLKLGAVSPRLMNIYREGGMCLEQLMSFTITDDHAAQERVWNSLSWNKSREMIRRMLTESHVPTSDRRARFIGAEAYEAAGGVIIRDLFDETDGGFFADPALLDRLVREKLDAEAEAVVQEGWRWVTVAPEFDYGLVSGLRRVYPEAIPLREEEKSRLDALDGEYEALSAQHDDEISEEVAAQFEKLETEIDVLRNQACYRPEDIAQGGAFVSLGYEGGIRVERGFVRPEHDQHETVDAEDETGAEGIAVSDRDGEGIDARDMDEDDDNDITPLPDRLVAELTAYRTAGLRDALAQNPDFALLAVVHALAARTFFSHDSVSCLEIKTESVALSTHAPGIAESPAERQIQERHVAWAARLPRTAQDLWAFLVAQSPTERLALLAHCAALSVNALRLPHLRRHRVEVHADCLAGALALDMTASWRPTAASYFGRVTKARILDAVREAGSENAATQMASMKKQAMADAAEALLAGSGWLPAILRASTPAGDTEHQPIAIAAE